jgi:hypothetical protein
MATPVGNLTARGSIITDNLFDPVEGTASGQRVEFDQSQLVQMDARKNEIIDYIRFRLGDGIIDIEADKHHFDMGIKQALLKYRQISSNASEESFAFLDIYPETQEYILPREIDVVQKIYRRGIGSITGTTASQFEPFASGYLNTYMLVAGRVGGLVNYELFVSYQKLAMVMFGGFMNFNWNPVSKKLTLVRKQPFNGKNFNEDHAESVLLHVYNKKPDVMLLNDQYAFPWIQEWALATVMLVIGEAREMFSSIPGPGGGTTLNGTALKTAAKEIMDQLIKDIQEYRDNGQPLTWVVG